MAVLHKNMSEQDAVTHILGSAHMLQAFMECSDKLRSHAKKMVRAITDPESDEEDRYLAAVTLYELLMPYENEGDGVYGMGLEYAENFVKEHSYPAGSLGAIDCDATAAVLREMDSQEATFAERLAGIMADRKLTQTEVARLTGVGQPAIAMMLKRECRPQQRTVAKLANGLGVTPGELWPEYAE